MHSEWRIKGTTFVKKKTGISSIDDLWGFDIEAFFEKQDKQFITYEEIDMDKLGRWVLELKEGKNYAEGNKEKLTWQHKYFAMLII